MAKPEIKKQMSLIFFFRTVHHRNKDLKQNSLKFYEGSDACKISLWNLIAHLTNICSSYQVTVVTDPMKTLPTQNNCNSLCVLFLYLYITQTSPVLFMICISCIHIDINCIDCSYIVILYNVQ